MPSAVCQGRKGVTYFRIDKRHRLRAALESSLNLRNVSTTMACANVSMVFNR
jgi:hypothetical protein